MKNAYRYVDVMPYGELIKVLDDYGAVDGDVNAVLVVCYSDLRSPLSLAAYVIWLGEPQLLFNFFIGHESWNKPKWITTVLLMDR